MDTITFGDLIDRYLIKVTPLKKSKDIESRRLKALKQQMGFMALSAIQNKDIPAYRDRRLNVEWMNDLNFYHLNDWKPLLSW